MLALYENYSDNASHFRNNLTGRVCINNPMQTRHDRLRRARIAKGYETAYDAAAAFGWNKNTYSSNENGNASFGYRRAQQYAAAFGVDAQWLYDGIDPNQSDRAQKREPHEMFETYNRNKDSVNSRGGGEKLPSQMFQISHTVPVLGYVEAGAWREMHRDAEVIREIFYENPLYNKKDMFALEISGDSINKFFPSGSTVVCVSPTKRLPRVNDFVVIRNYRGADLGETTIKRLKKTAKGAVYFAPESTNPKWQDPIYPKPRDEAAQEGLEVIGVVIGQYQDVEGDGEIVDISAFEGITSPVE